MQPIGADRHQACFAHHVPNLLWVLMSPHSAWRDLTMRDAWHCPFDWQPAPKVPGRRPDGLREFLAEHHHPLQTRLCTEHHRTKEAMARCAHRHPTMAHSLQALLAQCAHPLWAEFYGFEGEVARDFVCQNCDGELNDASVSNAFFSLTEGFPALPEETRGPTLVIDCSLCKHDNYFPVFVQ